MNEHPEYASQWKGRVLFHVSVEETDKPVAKTTLIDQDLVENSKDAADNKEYALICQIGQAVALPSVDKYNIKVTVGGHEILFEPLPQKNAVMYKRYGRCK